MVFAVCADNIIYKGVGMVTKNKSTQDEFILLCRSLRSLCETPVSGVVWFNEKEEKVYTNTHVLLVGNAGYKSDSYMGLYAMDVWDRDFPYPDIENVLGHKPEEGGVIAIPEDIYHHLGVFRIHRLKEAYVVFDSEGIEIVGSRRLSRPYSLKMTASFIDFSGIPFRISFDAAYITLLMPRVIRFGTGPDKMCSFEKCVAGGTRDLKHILVMPRFEGR